MELLVVNLFLILLLSSGSHCRSTSSGNMTILDFLRLSSMVGMENKLTDYLEVIGTKTNRYEEMVCKAVIAANTFNEKINRLVRLILIPFQSAFHEKKKDELKRKFALVNSRLSAIGKEIVDLQKQVQWSDETIELRTRQADIIDLANSFYLEADLPNKEQEREILIDKCKEKSGAAGLIQSMMRGGEKGILSRAMHYSTNDRPFMRQFSASLFSLLIQGYQYEIACRDIMGHKENAEALAEIRTQDLCEAANLILEADRKVKQLWKDTYKLDVSDIAAHTYSITHEKASEAVFEHLTEKFYWREWLVAVYDEKSESKAWNQVQTNQSGLCACDTLINRHHGRNIIVATMPQGIRLVSRSFIVNAETVHDCHGVKVNPPWARDIINQQENACAVAVVSGKFCLCATNGNELDYAEVKAECDIWKFKWRSKVFDTFIYSQLDRECQNEETDFNHLMLNCSAPMSSNDIKDLQNLPDIEMDGMDSDSAVVICSPANRSFNVWLNTVLPCTVIFLILCCCICIKSKGKRGRPKRY